MVGFEHMLADPYLRRLRITCLTTVLPAVAAAQGVTDRPPSLSGDWVGLPGTAYFNFVHRFSESGAPQHKVFNTPTFLLAAGLPGNTMIGVNCATNSALVPSFPNEHEYFARVAPVRQRHGFDLGLQADYNDAVRGADGELSVAQQLGPLRLVSAARLLSRLSDSSTGRFALAGGAVLRLMPYVSIAGDIGGLTTRAPGEQLAWGAGLQLQIPMTPHTVSLQATNVNVNTLQGISRGTNQRRYGFEFTIPITLRRYFSARPPEPLAAESSRIPASTTVRIQGMGYRQSAIEVAAGTTVEWRNDDPVAHTVTADDGSFRSPLIEPGRTWSHSFDKAGTFAYHCTPHPFMTGAVVVR